MSLPIAWIDRIFERLTLRYGRDFLGRWEGIPIADVKADWANVLGGFFTQPLAIAWTLDNLPDSKPPTAQEFRALCRKSPPVDDDPKKLAAPEPKADPERVKAELSKLRVGGERSDCKDWARRILAREKAGERIPPMNVRMAREALREYA